MAFLSSPSKIMNALGHFTFCWKPGWHGSGSGTHCVFCSGVCIAALFRLQVKRYFSGYYCSTQLVSWELSCDVSAPLLSAPGCPGLPALAAGAVQPSWSGLVPDSAVDGTAPLRLEQQGPSWGHPCLGYFPFLPGHVSSAFALQSQPWDRLLYSLRAVRRGSAGRVTGLPFGAGLPGSEEQSENKNTSRGSKTCLGAHLPKFLLGRSALLWENFSF